MYFLPSYSLTPDRRHRILYLTESLYYNLGFHANYFFHLSLFLLFRFFRFSFFGFPFLVFLFRFSFSVSSFSFFLIRFPSPVSSVIIPYPPGISKPHFSSLLRFQFRWFLHLLRKTQIRNRFFLPKDSERLFPYPPGISKPYFMRLPSINQG